MFNREVIKGGKKAGVTVELILAIVLSVVVLFVVLGLFNDNIKEMIANSNISRMFANNAASKTANINWSINPTQTEVNVQTIADQGLTSYLDRAQKTVDKYLATPPTTEAQLIELAKAVTIYNLGQSTSTNPITTGYSDLQTRDNFDVQITSYIVRTTLTDKSLSNIAKSIALRYNRADLNNDPGKLAIIKKITLTNFQNSQ